MDSLITAIAATAYSYFWLALVLYFLALWQPNRVLLWCALGLAIALVFSFFGYPSGYLAISHGLLDWLHLHPEAGDFDLPERYLPEVLKAFTRGFFLGLASVFALLGIAIPLVRLRSARGGG